MNITPSDKREEPRVIGVWIFLALAVWMAALHHFLFGRLILIEDAIPYYHHIKYFLHHLGHGVYPLWSPDWSCGASNEFFLRRLGSYNPFLLILLGINKLGVPFPAAYRIYLCGYYFIGVLGFYGVARKILKDSLSAYLAFLLLLFSALGTRIFDSYLLFMFVPTVWFLYFLISFHDAPSRRAFLGMMFALMIVLTTYIPFYFLTGIIFFGISMAIVLPKQVTAFGGKLFGFVKHRPAFFVLCLMLLILSALPGLMLFRHAGEGEVALPGRHTLLQEKNVLSVDAKTITDWSIPEEVVYSSFFTTDLRRIVFAACYVPVFAYILFFLGAFSRLNKRTLLLIVWALLFLVIGAPHATPVYFFLNKHIFFFKYFRNLHFFLWVYVLPIACLLVAGQFRQMFTEERGDPAVSKVWPVLIVGVHAGYFLYLWMYEKQIMTTYLTIGLSMVFFLWLWRVRHSPSGKGLARTGLALLVIVSLQPLQTYAYLATNSPQRTAPYIYDYVPSGFSFTTLEKKNVDIYYGSFWYSFLLQNLDYDVMMRFLRPKFIVYDRVEVIDEARLQDEAARIAKAKEKKKDLDTGGFLLKRMEAVFARQDNVAFVPDERAVKETPAGISAAAHPLIVEGNSGPFEVLNDQANAIRFRTHFDAPKFLVYHDTFHSGWKGTLNGAPLTIYRANLSFKGMWLPAGENTVELRFGEPWMYAFHFFLLGLFAAVFGLLLFLYGRPAFSMRGKR